MFDVFFECFTSKVASPSLRFTCTDAVGQRHIDPNVSILSLNHLRSGESEHPDLKHNTKDVMREHGGARNEPIISRLKSWLCRHLILWNKRLIQAVDEIRIQVVIILHVDQHCGRVIQSFGIL